MNLDYLILNDFKNLNEEERETIKDHIIYHNKLLNKQFNKKIKDTEAYNNWKEYFFEPIIEELKSLKIVSKRIKNEEYRTKKIFNHYLDVSKIHFGLRKNENSLAFIKLSCFFYYINTSKSSRKITKKIRKVMKEIEEQ